ncbi:sigma-54-dependent transcriptional regulator [Haliangium ochraceum]|uniref:Two component, sigma54 specific, transcriptional regulator, Fis family n=1 Tax=Haliangium ochraceum (strain DSM 14365 / JCM 11303 / SMP-2) TaxID=502025 RepID=D0LKJ8_HALO1|nr:sigma-54 dependent transcriptional regulator [Haliangium ochraceum]ACY15046.1 two component, sigma54 specific, transcriptional regulator, Fis family [Haliangium ochraceum DSM 14365]
MPAKARILVAEDETNLRRVLGAMLARDGYDIVFAVDGKDALGKIDDSIDVVVTDLKMPNIDGMEVLRRVAVEHPTLPVVMITAFGSVGHAVEAVKAGAFDYIEKPGEQEQIRAVIAKAVKQADANRAQPRLSTPEDASVGRFGLIGRSAEMQHVFQVIETVADTPSTVLITGESGTGKELVAKALHEHSCRKSRPFIRINCAAIPKDLMESEMFGYEKGAFTGAANAKPGRFELADGGTLFLDEIGEIPVEMQVKLLRAIQESEFERVGGISTLKVDVRLVTATNRDLEREVQRGNFREDLFYRLNVVPLRIPPLRERRSDIPLLVQHIIQKFNERLGKSLRGISEEAVAQLQEHAWPGNIRELENVLERTILFCNSERIEVSDLAGEQAPSGRRASSERPLEPEASEPLTGDTSLKEIVRAKTSQVERELIIQALDETGGNVTQAAKLLKISRKSLQMKMKEFGLRDREGA